jgi:GntR family transcriptional regulator, carbon starvation induced regulator
MAERQMSAGQARHVFEILRTRIVDGTAEPEARVNIALLAEEFAVSPGAVREALAMLEAEAWVVSEPAKGYRVSPVSEKALRDLVQARIEIEKLCLTEAIQHGDLAWEGAIVASFHHLSRVPERDSEISGKLNVEWVKSHAAFHNALVAGCPNDWLLRLHRMLYQQSERYRYLSVRVPNSKDRDVLSEHRALAEAVLNRDAEAAMRHIASHLQETANRVLRISRNSASSG